MELTKPYYNNSMTGNSRMLCCLSDRGELIRLYWPDIDFRQCIEKLTVGVFAQNTQWLEQTGDEYEQWYLRDTNMIRTVVKKNNLTLSVQTDYVLPDRDVLVRRYELPANMHQKLNGLTVYCSASGNGGDPASTLFDFDNDSMIFYRYGCYLSLSTSHHVKQFQIGKGAYEAAACGVLKGLDNTGMMSDGAFITEGVLPDCKGTVIHTLYICASDTLNGVKALTRAVKGVGEESLSGKTRRFWINYIDRAIPVSTGSTRLDSIYARSVFHLKLMTNERKGGILASPEVDEEHTKCGSYAYCWARDAAFITAAMDRCGLSPLAEKFYEWAADTQDEDGCWHQRYYTDGNLAPSWGLQVDETGTVVWGILQHFKAVKNIDFLIKMWECVQKAVDFLVAFLDNDTGLPMPGYDIWEERFGEHAYSAAAVYGGIIAGAEISAILGKPDKPADKWRKTASGIRDAVVNNLWKPDKGCFLRSVKTKLNPWGGEFSPDKTVVKYNIKGYYKDVTREDPTIDASILGVAVPFGMLSENDPRVIASAKNIEEKLLCPGTGGLMRYQNDSYMGGNPWVVTTLWMALFHIKTGSYQKALEYLKWAADTATETGLLPEQADRASGRPCWVYGLTWSHAMYILVLTDLAEAGVLPGK